MASSLVLAPSKDVLAANLFNYEINEQQIYQTDFDSADGWKLGQTNGQSLSDSTPVALNNGSLKNTTADWQRIFLDFSSFGLDSLDLDSGDIFVYLKFKTDKTKNENAKIYLELNSENRITPDPYYEQHHLAFNIRPTSNINTPYELYIDPAFYLPETNPQYQNYCQQWANSVGSSLSNCPYADPTRQDQVKQNLIPPNSLFNNSTTYESFRLMVSKSLSDTNVIEVNPQYLLNDIWNQFQTENGSSLPLTIDLTQKICQPNNFSNCNNDYLLLGQASFPSISLLFRSNVPTVDAFAITQIPKDINQITPEQVPEPNAVLGLGLLSFGAFFKRKFTNKQKQNSTSEIT
jgi:hypothetical protein